MSSAARQAPSGLALSLKALAADKASGYRIFQRDFAKNVLECIMSSRSSIQNGVGESILNIDNFQQYYTDLEHAHAAQPFNFTLNVFLCLPAAPDARPSAQHLLLERWLLNFEQDDKNTSTEEWKQASELAKLHAFEKSFREEINALPLQKSLLQKGISMTYGTLHDETMTSTFIQGGCNEKIFKLNTSHGTCRVLLEYRADLSCLQKEKSFILAFVPPSSSAVAHCYHTLSLSKKSSSPSSPTSPSAPRVASPSISINKLSLHSSDGAIINGKQYGRRGFSLASPPQLGSSPDVVRRLSSSAVISARSPMSPPSDLGPFAGSMEESLLSGRVRGLSPREKARFPPHTQIPFDALYYHIGDTSPYVATIPLDERGYRIPQRGTVQLTLRNPSRTPFKTFLVPYDLSAMPAETKTFIRQKISLGNPSRICYAIHLRFSSPKSGVYFLAKRIKIIFPPRLPDEGEELRISHDIPRDPQYFPY